MPTTPSINTLALQEILLGIADGLTDAQHQLRTMAPYDEYGRPNTLYQVPYLDFELQVTSEFETTTNPTTSEIKSKVKFQTAPTTAGNNHVEIFSTISGRFVAVMPNEGLPQIVIQVSVGAPELSTAMTSPPSPMPTLGSGDWYGIQLDVYLSNVAGEKLINSMVEFNFDPDATLTFNGTSTVTTPVFSVSELQTDANGLLKTFVFVKKTEYDAGRFIILSVNTGPVFKSISINQL